LTLWVNGFAYYQETHQVRESKRTPQGGPAGQPRAQALGTVAGPDVRPEWAVRAASAFPGWHPGRQCRQCSRAGLPCSTLQGRSVGDSPVARMRVSSQGLRPMLSCATLSGSSAWSKRISDRYAGKIYDDRHGSGATADCQTSAPHQAFTGNKHAAHSHSLTCGQQPARREENPRHDRNRDRYRNRPLVAAGINQAASNAAILPIANATAIPMPTFIPRREFT